MLYHLTVIAVLQVLLAFPYPHFHLLIKKQAAAIDHLIPSHMLS
jgi:hypothetical protein